MAHRGALWRQVRGMGTLVDKWRVVLTARRRARVKVHRLSPEAVREYTHVAGEDLARARIIVVPWLTPGVAAMTLGRLILVRRGNETAVGLIGHELVHVQQWREVGAIRFLWRYLGEYV